MPVGKHAYHQNRTWFHPYLASVLTTVFSKDSISIITNDTYISIIIFVDNYAQYVAKDMVERGEGGAIVNVSSQASQCALKEHAVYCK